MRKCAAVNSSLWGQSVFDVALIHAGLDSSPVFPWLTERRRLMRQILAEVREHREEVRGLLEHTGELALTGREQAERNRQAIACLQETFAAAARAAQWAPPQLPLAERTTEPLPHLKVVGEDG